MSQQYVQANVYIHMSVFKNFVTFLCTFYDDMLAFVAACIHSDT